MDLVAATTTLIPNGIKLPVLTGPLKGSRWIAGAAAGEGKGLSVLVNRSEPEQLAHAVKWVKSTSVCFDVGANVGFYTLLFARYGSLVYAFEPVPRNLAYLSRTLECNKLKNVVVVPWALSDTFGARSFELHDNCALGRLGPGGQPAVTISLDEFCETYHAEPDLIKIDVEGAEEAVLRGGRRMLERKRPALLLSVHSRELRAKCLGILCQMGYNLFKPLDIPRDGEAMSFACSA